MATSSQQDRPSIRETTSSSATGEEAGVPAGTLVAQRYRIEQWLGRGGMGAVCRAYDILKDRPVALKLLHRAMGSETSQAKRFHREAQILGRLRNPHVVAVYDHGRTDDGVLYLVMEYLEGETLQQRLQRQGHLPVGEALKILIAMLDGLAAVHRAGVVHRDVKPANIFLVRLPGGAWSTKLLDFGVAKIETTETTELTKAGQLCGTPRFMSPEQVLDRPIDHRSDLFSAAAVLYLALTGAMPYASDTPAQLVYALMQSTPVPLTRRRTQLQAHADLNRLVLHGLERTPDARYQSAAEMAAELRVLLAAEQTPSAQTSWWPRRLTPLAVRAAVLVLLGCSLVPFLGLGTATQVKYAGFAMNGPLVAPVLVDDLTAHGVTPLRDEIVAIDGHPWRSAQELRARLAALPLGAAVSYRLRRDAHERTVTMHVSIPSRRTFLSAYGMPYVGGLLIVIIGAVVAWSRPHLAAARALLMTTGCAGLGLLATRDFDFGGPLEFAAIAARSYAGVSFVHLALVYPSPWAPLRRHPWLIAIVHGVGTAILAIGVLGHRHSLYTHTWVRSVGLAIFVGIGILSIRQIRLRKRGATVAVRQAARQMLWAAVPLVFMGCMSLILGITGAFGGLMYAIAVSGAVVFALAIGDQIRRGDLFDLDLVFARLTHGLLRYVLLLVIFATTVGSVAAAARWSGSGPTVELLLAPLIGIAAVILTHEILSRRINDALQRDKTDTAAIITQFSIGLHSIDQDIDVIDLLLETLQRCYRPQKLRLLVRDGSGYLVRTFDDSAAMRPALVADVMIEPEDSDPSHKTEPPLSAIELGRRLSHFGRLRAHAGLILPIVDENEMTGEDNDTGLRHVLVLGPRSDGRAYSGDDAALIAALVHLAAARLQMVEAVGERATPSCSRDGESPISSG